MTEKIYLNDAFAKEIVKNGQIQLTTDQRRKMQDTKKKLIIDMIVRESILILQG